MYLSRPSRRGENRDEFSVFILFSLSCTLVLALIPLHLGPSIDEAIDDLLSPATSLALRMLIHGSHAVGNIGVVQFLFIS